MSGDGRGGTSGAGGESGSGSGRGRERGVQASGWRRGGASRSPLQAARVSRESSGDVAGFAIAVAGYPVRPVTRPAPIAADRGARTDTDSSRRSLPAPSMASPTSSSVKKGHTRNVSSTDERRGPPSPRSDRCRRS